MGGSVASSCSLHVRLSTFGKCPGLCAHDKATKTDKILPVRTYKIGLVPINPGNRIIHSRRKNFERTPRELQCSDRAQTSTTGCGRPSCVDGLGVLAKSARSNRRKFHNYTYTYTMSRHDSSHQLAIGSRQCRLSIRVGRLVECGIQIFLSGGGWFGA